MRFWWRGRIRRASAASANRTCPAGADPGKTQIGAVNHPDGGRGLYFETPTATRWGSFTRPYGSGGGSAGGPWSAPLDCGGGRGGAGVRGVFGPAAVA